VRSVLSRLGGLNTQDADGAVAYAPTLPGVIGPAR
jgi:hypothetical protein